MFLSLPLLLSPGFFFLFLAGIITWRVLSFAQAANRNALLCLSALMSVAGLICIVYQRHWFFSLSAAFRVPIYSIVGISLSFALAFAIAELLNYASTSGIPASNVPQRAQAALVQTPEQVFLLAAASLAMGFAYGVIFGFAEIGRGVFTLHTLRVRRCLCLMRACIGSRSPIVLRSWLFFGVPQRSLPGGSYGAHGIKRARTRNSVAFHYTPLPSLILRSRTLQSQFIYEERLCLPVGAVAGAITGYLNELWRPAPSGTDEKRGGLDGFGAEAGASARRTPAEDADFEPFRDSESATAAKNF